eukprot:5975158-Pyramimonas_sp.AAC.1
MSFFHPRPQRSCPLSWGSCSSWISFGWFWRPKAYPEGRNRGTIPSQSNVSSEVWVDIPQTDPRSTDRSSSS